MIASAHVAAGAVAALAGLTAAKSRAGRVAVAFALGLLSHVVLDAIPHSDYAPLSRSTVLWVSACEGMGVSVIAAYLLRRRGLPMWMGAFVAGIAGAVLPDAKFVAFVLLPPSVAESVGRYGDQFHQPFHAPPPATPAVGWALEIACTVALLAIVVAYRGKASAEAPVR